jgi:hypothetical protein
MLAQTHRATALCRHARAPVSPAHRRVQGLPNTRASGGSTVMIEPLTKPRCSRSTQWNLRRREHDDDVLDEALQTQ